MKTPIVIAAAIAGALLSSCMVAVNNPDAHSTDDTTTTVPQKFVSRNTASCFPFQDNENWWQYTEAGGNTTTILVTDTISDNGVLYHRVSFRENMVDTTDDWFKQTTGGVYFSRSLVGSYSMFLPAKIDSAKGSFMAAGSTVRYTWHDSLAVNGRLFYSVLHAEYSFPILHGFDEILFADSIGIVQLVDHDGRWPVAYALDSCSVSGVIKRF